MSHHNTLFPSAAGNTETVDFSYPVLNRRQFLLRTVVLAGATSLLVLPRKLTATSLLFNPTSRVRPSALLKNSISFTGQRQDPVTGLYHLGKGYRAYNPQIMRFHAADSLSPFGAGGFNPYAYALGDPINLIDPTGHMSGMGIAGFVLGVIGIFVSLTLIGLVSGALAIGLMIVGLITGIGAVVAGIASSSNDTETRETAGYISLGLGIASIFFVGGAIAAPYLITAFTLNKIGLAGTTAALAVSSV